MIFFSSLLYLGACGYIAARSVSWLSRQTEVVDFVAICLVMVSVFWVSFFLGFHILGYLDLAGGMGVVTLPHALAVLLLPALSLALIRTNRMQINITAAAWSNAPHIFDTHVAKATFLTYCMVAVMLAFGFPQGFEVMAYHLPGAVEILQTRSLRAWDGNFPHTLPANASIFYAFLLGMLPEKLVSAGNFVFLLPLSLSTVAIGLLVGADRRASALVACGLLTVPIIAFSSVELGSDIGGGAFVLVAMYFALTRSLPPTLRICLAGMCAGLAFGFKSLHLVSIAFLAMLIFAQAWSRASTRRSGAREGTGQTAVFCGGVLLTAGFWLARNYLDYGNPLYPVNLPVVTELAGWMKASDVDLATRHWTQFEWVRTPQEWLIYPWIEWHDNGQNFKHSSGLGPFIAASVPVAVLALSTAVINQGIGPHRDRFILLLAFIFIIAVWWVLDDHQPRYALAALVYSMPLVAWVVTHADRQWRGTYDAILSLCIAAGLMIFLSKQVLFFGDRIVFSGYSTRTQFYEYPREVDTLPAGATILNLADRAWHYPLVGSRLSNRIISMQEGRRLLGLEPGLTAPKRIQLRAAPLRASGVTHIFVSSAVLLPDSCIRLDELGRFDRNPSNGKMLSVPRLLFAVTYTNPMNASECKSGRGE